MDYKSMAQEYYETAERMKKIENKYSDLAKSGGKRNLEHYNSKAFYYHNLRYEALRIAKELEERGRKCELFDKKESKTISCNI